MTRRIDAKSNFADRPKAFDDAPTLNEAVERGAFIMRWSGLALFAALILAPFVQAYVRSWL